MRRIIVSALALLAASSAAQATPAFEFLRQGMDIVEVDKRLIEAGWQSERVHWSEVASNGPQMEHVYYELRIASVQSCRGTGLAGCEYKYTDARGETLTLRTIGEEGGGGLDQWRLNAPKFW